jgi:hypothetical protein
MRVAIGGKQLVVSLSSIGSECRLTAAESLAAFTDGQRRAAKVHLLREFSHDRVSRETAALLNGASRLRTP